MPRPPITILIDSAGIQDPEYPPSIRPDCEFWFEWLESHRSFRFQENTTDGLYKSRRFTANKDSRGYWTATRKLDGRLRRKRLGLSKDLTYNHLIEAANYLKADYQEIDINKAYQELRKKHDRLRWENINLASKVEFYKARCQELEAKLKIERATD